METRVFSHAFGIGPALSESFIPKEMVSTSYNAQTRRQSSEQENLRLRQHFDSEHSYYSELERKIMKAFSYIIEDIDHINRLAKGIQRVESASHVVCNFSYNDLAGEEGQSTRSGWSQTCHLLCEESASVYRKCREVVKDLKEILDDSKMHCNGDPSFSFGKDDNKEFERKYAENTNLSANPIEQESATRPKSFFDDKATLSSPPNIDYQSTNRHEQTHSSVDSSQNHEQSFKWSSTNGLKNDVHMKNRLLHLEEENQILREQLDEAGNQLEAAERELLEKSVCAKCEQEGIYKQEISDKFAWAIPDPTKLKQAKSVHEKEVQAEHTTTIDNLSKIHNQDFTVPTIQRSKSAKQRLLAGFRHLGKSVKSPQEHYVSANQNIFQ